MLMAVLLAALTEWSCNRSQAGEASNAGGADTVEVDSVTDPLALQIDSLLQWSHRRGMFNGAALVAKEGQVVYKGTYGFSKFRYRDSLSLNSAFQLASVSKVFTATAIMILQEQGLLEYDQKVKDLLPDFDYDTITVRHLLNHRSGLPRYMYLADKYTDRQTPIDNHKMLNLFCDPRPRLFFTPGNGFNYVNTNYAVLASVVESVSGQRFDAFVQKHIFDPVGMTGSTVFNAVDSTEIPNETWGHKGSRRRGVRGVDYYINGVVGDKGIYSTVEDLFKFDRALHEGKLLSPKTQEEAYTPGSTKERRDKKYYGFGWRLKTYKGRQLIFHNGWWMGYKTSFCRFVDDETTIILLTNTDRKLEVLPRIKALLYPNGEELLAEDPF